MRLFRVPRQPRKTWIIVGAAAILGNIPLFFGSHLWVKRAAAGRCFDRVQDLPACQTAVVLGCSPKVKGGWPNLFFLARIRAAAELYRAGKVKSIIASGDNSTPYYDEPTAMKEALMAEGVPADRIYCDYAGFRTLDSVIRAQAIFGQRQFIIVSQRFHNERAIFLARQHGLDAVGYNAADVAPEQARKTSVRECFARVQAVLDVTLLHTTPKFYGPPVVVTSD